MVNETSGSQTARIEVIPDGDEHPKWREIVQFIEDTGTQLDEWQMRVLWASLLQRGRLWAAFAVGVCAPRQNGKNGILEMRELLAPLLLNEKLLIHSAHLADTSKEGFRRLDDLIDANAWLDAHVEHVWRTNGHESIEFKGGNRIRFRTRTRGGGRGFSAGTVVFDEAMFLNEIAMGSILPVISAQPNPQIWYTGSAVDQQIHEDGVVFSRVRERALAGDDPRLAYFEWSADLDKPDELEDAIATDPQVWAQANPALGIRISPSYVEAEYRELDNRTFAVERLGVGDWPRTDATNTVIDLALWDELCDPSSKIGGDLSIAFDVSPNRSTSAIAASGPRAELVHTEVIESGKGTGWVVDRLVELAEKHKPKKVICDGAGPAGALLPELEKRGVTAEALTSQEYARACGVFFDMVEERKLRHLGTTELRSALKGAATRPLGDAWAWSRKNSGIDISPLVASTLAVWGSATARDADVFLGAW